MLLDSWKPETSWEKAPYPPRSPAALLRPSEVPDTEDPVELQERWDVQLPHPRPVLLLEDPQPLRVRCVTSQPRALHLDRGWVQVGRAEGPERLRGLWWRPEDAFHRDYWVVLVDDRVAWIFQEEGQWFLHGWFD